MLVKAKENLGSTLAIVGAGGHGKVVADAALCSGWHRIVFFDDAYPAKRTIGHWPIIGTFNDLMSSTQFTETVVAIGHNQTRVQKGEQLITHGFSLVSITHPAAIVSPFAKIGRGNVVFAGSVINPDAVIGDHCIINTNATIEHDCIIQAGVHISPGAILGGGVQIGKLSWVGIGAAVKHLVSIGESVIVGAGAAVIKDLPDHCTALGVPASIKSSILAN